MFKQMYNFLLNIPERYNFYTKTKKGSNELPYNILQLFIQADYLIACFFLGEIRLKLTLFCALLPFFLPILYDRFYLTCVS